MKFTVLAAVDPRLFDVLQRGIVAREPRAVSISTPLLIFSENIVACHATRLLALLNVRVDKNIYRNKNLICENRNRAIIQV